MIKNQRQYQITKSQLATFQKALKDAEVAPLEVESDAKAFRNLEIAALQSEVEVLAKDVAEYEELVSGKRKVIEVNSFEDIPSFLIQARIAAGMSQRELGERLGLKEQQIQRYEATSYESASFSRIGEVVKALGINIRKHILLPSVEVPLAMIWQRFQSFGISRDFILRRLLPRPLAAHAEAAEQDSASGHDGLALGIVSIVSKVFGFEPAAILSGQPQPLRGLAAQTARFKVPSRVKDASVNVYAVYAHYLALLVLSATAAGRKQPVPENWEDVRKAIAENYKGINFKSALQYVWSLGICVLPLKDSGNFHGACWRVEGRNVIVLKQKTYSQARWLIDLLHELFHALDNPNEKGFALIEESEMSETRRNSADEQEATEFAGDVVLDGRAEELGELCAHLAKGSIPRLKNVVLHVAKQEQVSVGALANYLAFRLSAQGEDWWGTAQNLQEQGEDPWRIAHDVLIERLNFSKLNPMDRELLSRALTESED